MHWDTVAEGLGEELGLSRLKFDEQRKARLVSGSGLIIDLTGDASGGTLHAEAVLGEDPRDPQVYRDLLSANLFGQGTGGAALSVADERGEILLERTFELSSIELPELAAQLESFASFAEEWLQELNGSSSDEDDADEP